MFDGRKFNFFKTFDICMDFCAWKNTTVNMKVEQKLIGCFISSLREFSEAKENEGGTDLAKKLSNTRWKWLAAKSESKCID